jgi:hypothetical protein
MGLYLGGHRCSSKAEAKAKGGGDLNLNLNLNLKQARPSAREERKAGAI